MKTKMMLLLSIVVLLGVAPMFAQTITYTTTGTLGPVLSGSDPLGANGKSGTIAITVSSTASPVAHTATTATYKLPAGAIVATIGGTTYTNSAAAKLKITASATVSAYAVSGPFSVSGITATITGTAHLKKGSFTAASLKHPTKFSPTPQTLTSPTSFVTYSASLIGTTKLGLAGSATN